MKKHIAITLLLLFAFCGTGYSYSGVIIQQVPSMPMPAQYKKTEQYQQALKVWENVYEKVLARSSNVQLPLMPMPTQYQKFEDYQQALKVWERVAISQGKDSHITEGIFIYIPPMPMPGQYKKLELYQEALQVWVSVSKNLVARNSNTPLPRMPMPTQYQKLEYYEYALQAWEKIFE
ncbi:hypothetical protein [Candidatus Parabeggiatoa sp. HSG14]|uniref:hypothetical protein n=1 Tax=Candidatus Parabeggiatoa sp. HSG14 TaxID=3055593 RepID=UPI0025A8E3EA|nr:hypothetical protein [Thiotrichales bacterium HSG14]